MVLGRLLGATRSEVAPALTGRPARAPCGLVSAELRPVAGSDRIARTLVDIADRAPGVTLLECTVNGQPGLVVQQDGVIVTVMAIDVAGDRIRTIWAVRNPEKLRPWTGES